MVNSESEDFFLKNQEEDFQFSGPPRPDAPGCADINQYPEMPPGALSANFRFEETGAQMAGIESDTAWDRGALNGKLQYNRR